MRLLTICDVDLHQENYLPSMVSQFYTSSLFYCEDIERFPKSAFCAIQVPLSPPPTLPILPRLIRGNDKAALSKCGQGKCKAVYTINECVSHVHQQIPGGKSTYTMHF